MRWFSEFARRGRSGDGASPNSPSRIRTATRSILFALVLAQAACAFPYLQATIESDQIERKLSQMFPLLDSNHHLFAVDSDYALQLLFDSKGALAEIQVAPKYTLSDIHPEWTEPDRMVFLGEPEYSHLLSQIEQAKPLGRLERKDPGSRYLSNDQYPALDEYENGVIRRSMRSGRGLPDSAVFPVASFHVFFFRLVSGHLDSIHESQNPDKTERICRVKLDDKEYWMERKDCESLKTGHNVSVKVAGPLNGDSD